MNNTEENKRVVLDFLSRLEQRSARSPLDALAETATWWVAGSSGLSGIKTKREVEQIMAAFHQRLAEPLSIEIRSVTAEEERVAVEARSRARLTNGGHYDNKVVFLFEVRSGKIQAVREYADTKHVSEILDP
jgi:ketosteroid isomerase-like protein